MTSRTPVHVAATVAAWDARREDQLELARRQWSAAALSWGIFNVAESEIHLFPDQLGGVRALELGCGTGYISAWLARAGARPVAVDPAGGQLAIARRFQGEFGLDFPLVRAAGEQVPLRSASFDLVISEYGAAIWADPYLWIPEAARLLRPGGELVFLGNSTLLCLCVPELDGLAASDALLRDQFGMCRFEWPDDPAVEFHLSHGDMIRLLRREGFEVEDLIEIQAPPGVETRASFVTSEWARRWPCEEVWRARRVRPR